MFLKKKKKERKISQQKKIPPHCLTALRATGLAKKFVQVFRTNFLVNPIL